MPNAERERYRLLLAEDDGGLRETLAELLSVAFDVHEAATGEAALERLTTDPEEPDLFFDLALFDLNLGTMSGLDVVRVVRRDRTPPPWLLMTARPTPDVRAEAEELGAAGLLHKPLGRRSLIQGVSQAMEIAYGKTDVATWFDASRN